MITSPFRFASYEPRFAIEHHDPRALRHAVELWQDLTFRRGPVTHAATYPSALLLTGGEHPGPFHPWRRVDAPDVVDYVTTWLATATVDEPQPNFDGAEAKGFCAFWGYFNGAELDHGYGAFVVTTKWIEIHK